MVFFRGASLGTLLVLCGSTYCQWEPVGVPFRVFNVFSINADDLSDALYFCGVTSLNNDFDTSDGAIPIFNNGQWDTLSVFGGDPTSVARWGDTLVIAGNFWSSPSIPFFGIVGRVNDSWVSFGNFAENAIYRLKVINGDLYAIGAFNEVDGQSCQGVAKRVNGQWAPVGTFDVINSPNIQDLVEWDGALYATGTIRFGAPNPKDVAYLTSTGEWLPLGPGIQGGFGAGRALAVYNNELYVSGSIPIAAGNAGHGIMRWDGQQFHPVGTGFQGLDGTYASLVGASELEVYDGKLWACGTFSYAGNVPCPGIAYWDGARWCGLPAGIHPEVNSIEFFHDTLFASCNNWDINCAMRFTGSAYSDTCSVAVGVPSLVSSAPQGLRAYRDAEGILNILGLPPGTACMAEVFDAEGRSVHRQQGYAVGDRMQFQLPPLGPGAYIIRLGQHGALRFLGP